MHRPFAAYTGSEPYIFVSYAHEDAAVVYPELDWLKRQGFNLWFDEGIAPGEEWSDELARKIEGASTFLYFISPRSVESRNCRSEVQFALKHGKRLIAVHLQPTELPRSLDLSIGLDQAVLKHELTDAVYRNKLVAGLPAAISAGAVDESLSKQPRQRARAAIGVALAAVAIATLVVWRMLPTDQPAPIDVKPTIAVLPFKNLSDDPAQEYFSDGVSEDILNGLAKHSGLIVRARASSFALKDTEQTLANIGSLLNVTHAVEGSIRRDGNRIRVTAQLVSVTGDRQVWSERYDRELTDVFAVQDEITGAILAALRVHLLEDPRTQGTKSLQAYDAYLRGRNHFNYFEFDDAVAAYRQAIDLDLEYADAWAGLAQVQDMYAWVGLAPAHTTHALVREYTARALAADPLHPPGLGERAMTLGFVDIEFQASLDEFDRLIRRYPSNVQIALYYGFLMSALGQHDAAVDLAERVVTLDPLSGASVQSLGMTLGLAGRLGEARAAYERAEALGVLLPSTLAMSALVEQDFATAQHYLDLDDSAWGADLRWRVVVRALIPHMQHDLPRAAELIDAGGSPDITPGPYMLHVHALIRGDIDRAFEFYAQALAERDPLAVLFSNGRANIHRLFPGFYGDPRFARLLEEVDLDPVSIVALNIPPIPDAQQLSD